jgi:hypothetical protein
MEFHDMFFKALVATQINEECSEINSKQENNGGGIAFSTLFPKFIGHVQ